MAFIWYMIWSSSHTFVSYPSNNLLTFFFETNLRYLIRWRSETHPNLASSVAMTTACFVARTAGQNIWQIGLYYFYLFIYFSSVVITVFAVNSEIKVSNMWDKGDCQLEAVANSLRKVVVEGKSYQTIKKNKIKTF